METSHLPIGTLLQGGKYKIVRFISSGGFGCTYEAEHVLLEKRVAIKEFFVKDFCNRDETTAHVTVGTQSKKGLVDKLRRKFIDEAKAVCKLEHKNIVRVSDVFEENGTAYFVMNYINGLSLGDIVKREHIIQEQRAVKYIRQIAEALRYVHDRNRLHLDVKPGNIIINEYDDAILIDFGASKQYDEENGENTSTLMGKTPGYAPPEQMGNDVTKLLPATDIYALGATLYKILTGITPISSELIISGEELDPLPKETSENVAKAITAAMQINKGKRPQSIAAFMSILDGDVAEDEVTVITVGTRKQEKPEQSATPKTKPKEPPVVTPPPKKNDEKKWNGMVIIAIVCLVVAIVAIIIGSGNSETPTETPIATSVIEETVSPADVENQQMTYNGETYTYTGPVNDAGKAEGQGEGIYNSGTYKGHYVNGCREGKGTYDRKDDTFEGTFKNNEYDEGVFTYKDDGMYFKGTFKDEEPYNGKWYNRDGTVIEEVKNGKEI